MALTSIEAAKRGTGKGTGKKSKPGAAKPSKSGAPKPASKPTKKSR